MEIRAKKNELQNLLRWSQGIAEKRSAMQILSNLLLEVKDRILRITATDLEISIVTEGEIEGKGSGRLAVHARHLYDIVREAPEEEVKIKCDDSYGVELISGKARFRMVGLNPDDFPQIPNPANKTAVPLNDEELTEMIESTFYAVSTDETRYTLNGIYLTRGDGTTGQSTLRMVATDGHRLSYSERPLGQGWDLGRGLLVPRKGIQELKKVLAEGSGDLTVSHDEKTIQFQRGNVTLLVRLVDGEFPAYEQVIPRNLDKIASVDHELFSGALKRASILSSSEGQGVRFGFSGNVLEVSSSNPDVGETREEIPIDYKGAKFEVAFNPRYFLDLLSVVEDKKIVLELKDDVSPCVIRSEFDRNFLALVMPMRL